MTLKTLEYQLCKAEYIAINNPDAIIGFFCTWSELKPLLQSELSGGTLNTRTRSIAYDNNAMIRLIDERSLEDACAGAQFTHVFSNGIYDYKRVAYMRSRIRTTNIFNYPSGYFDEIGFLRYEDY